MPLLLNTLILTSLVSTLIIADTPVLAIETPRQPGSISANDQTGYTVLKLLLEDEQYLTTIRRTRMIVTFTGINDTTIKLIDEISNSSIKAIDELELLADEKPTILFHELEDNTIEKSTLDSLRMTTAKEFIFDGDNFEKNLLLSQLKVLRLISHLATQLKEVEPSVKRRAWLNELAKQYEIYYQRTIMRISLNN